MPASANTTILSSLFNASIAVKNAWFNLNCVPNKSKGLCAVYVVLLSRPYSHPVPPELIFINCPEVPN